MTENEVHVVELQALERSVDCAEKILPVERVLLIRTVVQTPEELRRYDVRRAPPAELLQDIAHDGLGRASGIDLGVVEEIHTGCKGRGHAFAGELLPHLVAIGDPGAQGELAHPEPGGAKSTIVHDVPSLPHRSRRPDCVPCTIRRSRGGPKHSKPQTNKPLPEHSMPQNKRPLSVEDLWAIKRIGAPTLSPDGSLACAAVTAFDMEKNEGRTELWLFPTDGGRAKRLTAGDKDSEPTWSPDGKWIAFAAKRKDDEEPQIYLIAPDGGEARRLTSVANGAAGLRWFPDSKRI